MSGSMFKHNKRRNSGLVYEFLVRRLGAAMISNDKQTYRKTLEIIHKYYGDGTLLSEERELFDVIRNSRGLSESAARRILAEVQRHARKMDAHKVDIKKSCLIKEINYSFGKEFFVEHRIPDYRLLASIQMVVDACRGEALLQESVSKIQLEEGLVQYMTSKGSYSVAPASKTEVDALVMRMAAKRFDEKYSRALVPAQKQLLERYIRYQVSGDPRPLAAWTETEHARVRQVLERAMGSTEVRDDPVMKVKLDEAYTHFTRSGKRQLDEEVEDLMLFQKLAAEIESDE